MQIFFIINERLQKSACDGSLAQLGEHLPYKQRVTGSSPVPMVRRSSSAWLERQPVTLEVEGSSPFCVAIRPEPSGSGLSFAQIAQSVEQGTENPRVTGSIPVLGTRRERELALSFFFICT